MVVFGLYSTSRSPDSMKKQTPRQTIITFLQSHIKDKNAVLGLSGGIDSSLVAFLAAEALGKERVFGILLPSDTNSADDTTYANLVAKTLCIATKTIAINDIARQYKSDSNFFSDARSLGNLKARIRMTLLYGNAYEQNALVLGTGNKTELAIGYFTKYGDGGVDLLPIGDLYKAQVRQLAREVGVPNQIIDRPPTAGLWEGQTDEEELGISYETLDAILKAMNEQKSLDAFTRKDIALVRQRIKETEHKPQTLPICFLQKPYND